MSRRPVIPRDCGLWSHGNRCCIGTTRTKSCCIGTQKHKSCCKQPKTFSMVSRVHGLTTWSHDNLSKNFMVSKMQKKCEMQKKCVWAEMYQNDGLSWISPGVKHICGCLLNRLAHRCSGTCSCLPPRTLICAPDCSPLRTSHASIYDGSESPKYNFKYHFNFHNCPNCTIVD